jgi:hypothetical protein
LTDVDGVLLNWVDGFERYMSDTHGLITIDTSDYDLAVRYGIPSNQVFSYIEAFNHSTAIGDLVPDWDATTYIYKLTKLGYRFVVVTSLSKLDSACKLRIANLQRVYGDIFDDFVFLDIGEKKTDALKKFEGQGYAGWVEDLPANAVDGHDIGLKTFLIDQSYNSDFQHEAIQRVGGWKEIYEHFESANANLFIQE